MSRKPTQIKHYRSRNELRERTSEKSSRPQQKHHRCRAKYNAWNRKNRASFRRWVASLAAKRQAYWEILPEYFITVFAKGPNILPKTGKRIRLGLDYFLFLRDEDYQIPHAIRNPDTLSAITCKIELTKQLPGQDKIPVAKRRSQIVVSYQAPQGSFTLLNTPDYAFDLETIGNELDLCVNSDRLQFLYDPNGLTLDYQGVLLRSLGSSVTGGKTITLYAPPHCRTNNHLEYENTHNWNKLQVAFFVKSGPDLQKLKECAKKLQAKQPVFVDYELEKYYFSQEGKLLFSYESERQEFCLTVKLTGISFNETGATDEIDKISEINETGENQDASKAGETSTSCATSEGAEDLQNCVVSGFIHQSSFRHDRDLYYSYKINYEEDDQRLFEIFNYIRIQHWQAKEEYSPEVTFDSIYERRKVTPPFSYRHSPIPERAAVCHFLGKNLNKFGAFPYVDVPSMEAWTVAKPVQNFIPRTRKSK